MKEITPFTANWLGRCPVKGCKSVIHLDVPMVRETWTETHHDHAHGHSWPVSKRREYPVRQGFHPHQLGLACAAHRRDLGWLPINGKYVADHVCDARCMNAIGPNCECGCGGKNHGRGFHYELKFNQ